MIFDIDYDRNGKPEYVRTDTGFCQTGEPFDPNEHGWMLTQLDPEDIEPRTLRESIEFHDQLVREVNKLRRKVWQLERIYVSPRI